MQWSRNRRKKKRPVTVSSCVSLNLNKKIILIKEEIFKIGWEGCFTNMSRKLKTLSRPTLFVLSCLKFFPVIYETITQRSVIKDFTCAARGDYSSQGFGELQVKVTSGNAWLGSVSPLLARHFLGQMSLDRKNLLK